MSVVVMICFARSGGTLLNRCLGSLPRTVVLSEVNPLGGGWGREGKDSLKTVKAQSRHWYDIEVTSDDFAEGILELDKACEDSDRQLIVRDWSFINFVPHDYNDWVPPNRFLTLDAIADKCQVTAFAFVRDAVDVWLSRGGAMEDFFPHYLCYVRALLEYGIRIFRYEDFCRNPDVVMREMCTFIGVEYSDEYRNFASFTRVNGDIQAPEGSRGIGQGEIGILPRRALSKSDIVLLDRNGDMVEANRLMGYPASYSGRGNVKGLLMRLAGLFRP